MIATESEYYVIGAVLIDQTILSSIDLTPDEFQSLDNRIIFSEILSLSKRGIIPDLISLGSSLEAKTKNDWMKTLAVIQKNAYSTRLIHQHIEIIRKSNSNNKIREIAEQLIGAANDGTGLEHVGNAISDLMRITDRQRDYECSAVELCNSAVEKINEALDRNGLSGITTGLRDLDACIGGWQDTDLYVIGARPAMGKTAFLLNSILAIENRCGFISTEQGREQIGLRAFSIAGSVNAQKLRVPTNLQEFEWDRAKTAAEKIKNKNLWVNDNPVITIDEIISIARKWKYLYKIEILFVDYIQRIKGDYRLSKVDQVTEITMGLKRIARELNIPVVALSQVARAVDSRTDKRPTMSDLSDSSAIEKEADVVITLYRDEVYDENTADRGICEVHVEKNRHGPTGMKRVQWVGEYMQVRDLPDEYSRHF